MSEAIVTNVQVGEKPLLEKVFTPDEKNWKPVSTVWPVLQLVGFLIAIAVSFFLPKVQKVDETAYRVLLFALLLFFAVRYALTFVPSDFRGRLKRRVNHQAQLYFAVALTLAVWDVLSTKTNTLLLPFFPGPAQILQVMAEDYSTLLISTGFSLRLLVVGFAIGLAIGFATGVLIGWYRQWNYWLFPVFKILGVIPATAWLPITMIAFKASGVSQVVLIVLCVWFPVAYMTSSGILNLPKSYFEAARTIGANEWFLIFRVAIPGSMPSIFTGVYTAISLAFTTLVVSEMIGAKAGLGFYINWAKGWSNYAKVYASIIIMGIVFSVIMSLIFHIRDHVLVWQKGLTK